MSDHFIGTVKTDIHGDVVTALDSNGGFTVSGTVVAVQSAAIDGLNSTGAIAGGMSPSAAL